MAKTKANEREFQGQVIAWIKKQIEQGGLPFGNATNDSSLYGLPTVKFPDVLLALDFERQNPFCGWELKTPKTDVRDKELLKDAVKKAQILKAKYFVTWNMQTAIIWRTPEGTRATVNENDKKQEFGPYHQITTVDDIRDEQKALVLESICVRLLWDLGNLYRDEKIDLPVADTTVFVEMVRHAGQAMVEPLLKDIRKATGEREFRKKLNAWATKQGVNKYDQEYEKTLAQQIAYKIIGKVLFYITLRRHKLDLPPMELPAKSYKTAITKMRGLFQRALEVDYQAIFEPEIVDEIELSADTAKIIIELTDKLTHWSFELMPLDVIGNVFEKLIPEDARHSLGQYFTPDNLVDLITTFCVNKSDDYVMDPTCGTGTFLIRGYNRLRNLQHKAHYKLLEQIWGIDIAGFPAELATVNLCRQDFSDYLNFPRVLSRDFFDVMPGQKFKFPPPKKTAKTGERIEVKIPKFDALVGNFPFIRQELIEKAEPGYKNKIGRVLHRSWENEYPQLFEDVKKEGRGETSVKMALSGQADIYAYMFFHAASHLKVGGRMGFITSNSWLDVAYGYELQKFFLEKFKVIAICESRCEPWFEQSAVNTVFAILERCDDKKAKDDNLARFVKIKKPLKELFPQDALIDSQRRWIALEKFVDKIEGIAASGDITEISGCKKFEKISKEFARQPEIISYEDEGVRIRLVRQKDLKKEVADAGETVKWGQYLRAPDIYFEILEKCADKFVPLGKGEDKVADIRFGIKTGINEFFYLTKDNIEHWGIEKEFLKPVVTSSKEIPGIFVDEKKLTQMLFICRKDKKELKGTRALKYIEWGEGQTTNDKTTLWAKVESVKGRKNWYSIPENELADFLILRFRDRRHYTPINPGHFAIGDVVFVGEFLDKSNTEIGCAYLNSIIISLFAEVLGRANLGEGLLTTYGPEIESLPVPLKNLSKEDAAEVVTTFKKLYKRDVLPFDEEIKRSDRKNFEAAVFKSLGLSEKDYKNVCEAVNVLIEERHLLAISRKKKTKDRNIRDLDKLREEIGREVIPDGVKQFPGGFITGFEKIRCSEVGLLAGKLKLGEFFLGKQEICNIEGEHVQEESSFVRAKFIVYAKRGDELIVKIPDSEIVIKKAVLDYELYLKELKEKLYRAFMEQCGDHTLSENMAQQIFEDYGLPDIR